jgi:hypothetical protein
MSPSYHPPASSDQRHALALLPPARDAEGMAKPLSKLVTESAAGEERCVAMEEAA